MLQFWIVMYLIFAPFFAISSTTAAWSIDFWYMAAVQPSMYWTSLFGSATIRVLSNCPIPCALILK